MATERIDKTFSRLGLLSRTECKAAVKNGQISVNDRICSSSNEKINLDSDTIYYKGNPIDSRSIVYYMFNKPAGCITANEDKYSATIFDYIKDSRIDLSAVGRLDKDTTGILLITNDGMMNHRLLSSRYHVPKTYVALAQGIPNEDDIALFERGLDIGDNKPTLPAICKVLEIKDGQTVFELTITEGRFHQVKRMFRAINMPVIKLHRRKFGPLDLDENLKPGEYRELTAEEINKLIEITK